MKTHKTLHVLYSWSWAKGQRDQVRENGIASVIMKSANDLIGIQMWSSEDNT